MMIQRSRESRIRQTEASFNTSGKLFLFMIIIKGSINSPTNLFSMLVGILLGPVALDTVMSEMYFLTSD